MSYSLVFKQEALSEWRRLESGLRVQFKKKLAERLIAPHVPSARLSGQKHRYKIKLRSAGYRLVYEVRDAELAVVIIAVGKRDRNLVYRLAERR